MMVVVNVELEYSVIDCLMWIMECVLPVSF